MKTSSALFAVTSLIMSATPPAVATPSLEDQISALEEAWSDAVVNHHPDKVRQILDESFIGVDGRGVVSSRDDEIAEATSNDHTSTSSLLSEALSDIRVRVYGETAVLTAINTAVFKKAATTFTIRCRRTTIYVRSNGIWRCVGFHGSRMV